MDELSEFISGEGKADRRRFLEIGGVCGVALTGGCSGVLSEPASIEIVDVDHADEVAFGETVRVDLVVNNVGDEEGTDDVRLSIGSQLIEVDEVTLAGGERTEFTHTANSEEYGSGYHTVAVETSDDDHESELRVADPEPPELVVSAVELPEIGSHDESISADIELYNRGDLTAEQTITLSVDGDVVVARKITLEGGDRDEITIDIDEEAFFSGHYRVDIETDHDAVRRNIEIENPNPYGKETLIVGLNQQVPARHDIDQIVQDALSYWEDKSEQYAGYSITYKYRPNAADPDVEITLVEEITSCGGSSGDGIAGCAHYVQDLAPSTVEISLVDGYRREWMTTTLIHELGHTLGIGHGEEPAHIMSDDIEDRIPDYRARTDAIRRYTEFFEPYGNGQEALTRALEAYGSRNYAASESAAIDSANYFETARGRVIDTRRTANRLDESEAYALAEEAAEHIYYLRLTAEETIEMAREASYGGNPEPHRQAAMDYLDKAERYQLHEPAKLMRAFGLPVKE